MGHSIKQRQQPRKSNKMNSLAKITCLILIFSLCQGYSVNRRGQNSRSWNKRSDRQNSGFNPGRDGNNGIGNGNGNSGYNNGNNGFNSGNGGFNSGNGGFNNGNGGFNNGNGGFNNGNSGYNNGNGNGGF